jgi:alkylation response protein AidB-like acyl-CoA dehydrogenase
LAILPVRVRGSAPIFLVGSEEQRQTYFMPAIAGEKIAAAGLTEPNVGSIALDNVWVPEDALLGERGRASTT